MNVFDKEAPAPRRPAIDAVTGEPLAATRVGVRPPGTARDGGGCSPHGRGAALALAALALFAPRLATGQVGERELTLREAVAQALERNEAIILERESAIAAEAAIEAARGAYDPLLGVEAAWQRATLPVNSAFSGAPADQAAPTAESAGGTVTLEQLLPTGGALSLRSAASRTSTDGSFELLSPAYWTRIGVELRQPLLRGREVDAARLAVRVATADRDGAVAALRRELTETVAAVERAYWSLVAVRRAVEVREEAVRLAEEQLSETRARIESGMAPETEIAQPRAELERRRGELLAAREAVARAGNSLRLLILADDDPLWAAELSPVDPIETATVTVDVAAAIERALASRAELEAAAASIARRRVETSFAHDGRRASLDVVLSYDRFGLAGTVNPAGSGLPGLPVEVPGALTGGWSQSLEVMGDGDFDDSRVALVLGIPVGNRTARATIAAAASAERQAEAELARTRKAIRAEVLDAAATLETAGQRIEAAHAARAAAEVQLDAERERFAVGLSTNFLVLTRQNDLARARLDEIAALTDYRTATAELGRATGALLEQHGISFAAPVADGRGAPTS